jgi:DNA-binding response OmpR family regulator
VVEESKLDVCVVDDETTIGEVLVDALSQEGYQAAWVATAYDALRQAAERRPRIVLSDVMLPGMDGVELIERIEASGARPRPRCILMSAAPPPRNAPDDVLFLRKPFELDSILDLIRDELARAGAQPRAEGQRN